MLSLSSLKPVDYAILGTSGAVAVFGLACLLYAVPWGSKSARRGSAVRELNAMWPSRLLLELSLAVWALLQVLRLSSLWGPHSFALPSNVTRWTGEGWLCRIYLTAALGVAAPLCAFLCLLLLASAARRGRAATLPGDDVSSDAPAWPNCHILGHALLYTCPVAAVQAVVAWISLAITYDGTTLELAPRTVLAYFFAVYWHGTPQQCGDGDAAAAAPPTAIGTCTLCVFPAAAAIAHLAWTLPFLLALCVTTSRTAATALNKSLKRRLRLCVALWSLLALAGCGAVGASVVAGPFTWVNQGCWIGYFVSVVATAVLLSVEVVLWPVRELRAASTRARAWRQPSGPTLAQAVVNRHGGKEEREAKARGFAGGFAQGYHGSATAGGAVGTIYSGTHQYAGGEAPGGGGSSPTIGAVRPPSAASSSALSAYTGAGPSSTPAPLAAPPHASSRLLFNQYQPAPYGSPYPPAARSSPQLGAGYYTPFSGLGQHYGGAGGGAGAGSGEYSSRHSSWGHGSWGYNG